MTILSVITFSFSVVDGTEECESLSAILRCLLDDESVCLQEPPLVKHAANIVKNKSFDNYEI